MLAAYIRSPETENHGEKCTYYGARGFFEEDPEEHIEEMVDLARSATRSRDPIIHYVLSWRTGEQPTPEQLEAALDIFANELDALPKPRKLRDDHTWRDHQWIYGLHADTANYHLHLMINRVDPESARVIEINRGYDVDAGIRAGARIEHVQGWKPEANKRYRIAADGSVVRASAGDRNAPRRPSQRDLRRERETGRPSATRIAIDRALPIIAQATTWAELHADLGAVGMRYVRSGPGAVVMVGDAPVRASQVDPAATLDALADAERLGPYKPAQGSKPDPVRPTDISRIIRDATTWRSMHASLANVRVTYERKGSGAVVRTTNGTTWKASEISRDATLGCLEDRLGAFEPPAAPPADRAPNAKPTPTATDPTSAAAIIDDAKSWHELHLELNWCGIAYERKGSGAIVRAGDTQWKASQVSRRATLAQLERRLGPFEPAAQSRPAGPDAGRRTEYHRDRTEAIADQRRDTEAERAQHDEEIARIDRRARDEHDEIARHFPRPPPPRAKPRDKETPSPPDDDAAQARKAREAREAREARIIHDAVTLAYARKARRKRARARENRRYRRVMTEIRRRYERMTRFFDWLIDRGHLAPARGWDQPEPDAVVRPADYVPPQSPNHHVTSELEPYTVGQRVDYADHRGDVACADLGAYLIVRRPTELARHLAALEISIQKWGRTSLEAVNLPAPGEARDVAPIVRSVRPIVDIHAEIRELEKIAAAADRATRTVAKQRRPGRGRGLDD